MGFRDWLTDRRRRFEQRYEEFQQREATRTAAEQRQVQRRRDRQYLRELYFGGQGQESQRRQTRAALRQQRRDRGERER